MPSVLLAGARRMGTTMLRGWVAALDPRTQFNVLDPNAAPTLPDTCAQISRYTDVTEIPENCCPGNFVLATNHR